MFGIKRRKILRKAIELTHKFSTTQGTAARNVKFQAVSPFSKEAVYFCAVGYLAKAALMVGLDGANITPKLITRIEDKNKLAADLALHFDLKLGTPEDARKLFEKAL